MNAAKIKIPGQVKLLGAVSLFTDIASEMLYPITPIFMTAVLGSSMALVGLMEGLAEVTAGFLKGYFGFLSDKIKKRALFIIAGYGVSALSKPLPGIFPSTGIVLAARITDRIGKGVRTAPRDALLAGYSSGNTGSIFGFHRSMDTLGAATGPVLALVLLGFFNQDYRLVFISAFIPSLIAVLLTLSVKDKPPEKVSLYQGNLKIFWSEAPAAYKKILVLLTLFSLVNSSDVFLILRSAGVAKSSAWGIAGYIIYNLVYAASSYPAGKLSDKLGKKKVLGAGLLIFSFVYAGFAVATDVYIIFILFAIYGIYAAATEGISKAWVSDLIPDRMRGSAIGMLTMSVSLASLCGSLLTGILWDNFGPAVPFFLSSAVSLLIASAFFLVNTKK